MDLAKSLWDLEIHDQNCRGPVSSFSCTDMLPKCGLVLRDCAERGGEDNKTAGLIEGSQREEKGHTQ